MSDRHPADDPSATVTIRVYGQLDDFLSPGRRGAAAVRRIDGSPAVKDVVEAIGVPHPEVGLILVDGEAVGFEHRLEPGDRVAVYPPFRALDLGSTVRPAPDSGPPDDPRFVLDGHLGRLAAYLRMCGFDTWYERRAADEALARVAADEARILLTRDRGLLKRAIVGLRDSSSRSSTASISRQPSVRSPGACAATRRSSPSRTARRATACRPACTASRSSSAPAPSAAGSSGAAPTGAGWSD
jgi:hypothetical protein